MEKERKTSGIKRLNAQGRKEDEIEGRKIGRELCSVDVYVSSICVYFCVRYLCGGV